MGWRFACTGGPEVRSEGHGLRDVKHVLSFDGPPVRGSRPLLPIDDPNSRRQFTIRTVSDAPRGTP